MLANLNDFLKLTVCLVISLKLMQRDAQEEILCEISSRLRDDLKYCQTIQANMMLNIVRTLVKIVRWHFLFMKS